MKTFCAATGASFRYFACAFVTTRPSRNEDFWVIRPLEAPVASRKMSCVVIDQRDEHGLGSSILLSHFLQRANNRAGEIPLNAPEQPDRHGRVSGADSNPKANHRSFPLL